MTDIWAGIVGWEGLYEVSDAGSVRSLPRTVRGGNGSVAVRGGRVLRSAVSAGYQHVTLSNGLYRKSARVHVLVAEAFLGPRPVGMNVCHYDGKAGNNAASNLYWATQLQNMSDKIRHGTDRFALKRGVCKHGHEFTSENTYLSASGSPTCRTCRRDGMRNRKARS